MPDHKLKIALVLGVAVALVLAGASLALATETSRAEYVAAVEPICHSNTQASEKILKGVKAEVKAGKLAPAATQFAKAAKALKRTLAQLKAVPQPTADAARLAKWFGYIGNEVELFEATAKKLKAGDKDGAEKMTLILTHTANLANDQVLVFGFRYCHGEPSRFS